MDFTRIDDVDLFREDVDPQLEYTAACSPIITHFRARYEIILYYIIQAYREVHYTLKVPILHSNTYIYMINILCYILKKSFGLKLEYK